MTLNKRTDDAAATGRRPDPKVTGEFRILGQELFIPFNWQTAAIVLIVVTGLIVLEVLTGKPSDLVSQYLEGETYQRDKDGTFQLTDRANATIYEFWTPGAETVATLEANDYVLDPKERLWYTTDSAILKAFGAALAKESQGYSRFEAWGEGTRPLKKGWTWRVTVPASSDFNSAKLIELYGHHFNVDGDRRLYIERTVVGRTLVPAEQ